MNHLLTNNNLARSGKQGLAQCNYCARFLLHFTLLYQILQLLCKVFTPHTLLCNFSTLTVPLNSNIVQAFYSTYHTVTLKATIGQGFYLYCTTVCNYCARFILNFTLLHHLMQLLGKVSTFTVTLNATIVQA